LLGEAAGHADANGTTAASILVPAAIGSKLWPDALPPIASGRLGGA
jgi:hypothetical protein